MAYYLSLDSRLTIYGASKRFALLQHVFGITLHLKVIEANTKSNLLEAEYG
jgi:hypothetical protein